jgi:hypothetical protein
MSLALDSLACGLGYRCGLGYDLKYLNVKLIVKETTHGALVGWIL